MAKVKATKAESYIVSPDQLFAEYKDRKVIPCTLSTDIALSGGIVLGGTVVIGSRPKLGKTTICLQWAANAQQKFGSQVFFFSPEGRLHPETFKQVRGLKTDIDNFKIIRPPTIEKDGKIVGHQKWWAEKWWDVIGKTIEDNPGCVGIVDSISSMSSEKEFSEEMGYQERGRRQQLEAQFCRKYGEIIASNNFTLFLIAQIQANTSGYGSPYQIKAGNAIQHQADVAIVGTKKEVVTNSEGKPIGHDIHFKIEHNLMGPPGEMKVPLTYGYGIDNARDILLHGIEWGLIHQKGSWITFPFEDEETNVVTEVGENSPKAQGELKARAWLIMNPEKAAALETRIKDIIFGESLEIS